MEATPTHPPGRIFTFYSYKGGTGRTMGLANVAWILAAAGKRVLAVDWDLEAPGLHRYFRPFLVDESLAASDGVLDLVIQYATAAAKPGLNDRNDAWIRQQADLEPYVISLEWKFPGNGTLDLIPAGRQTAAYAARLSAFNWQTFYDHLGGGTFIEALRDRMRAEYDYVLIDSRTGVADTAGICTVQLPDDLVTCFTYNNQSTEGALRVAQSMYQQRAAAADARVGIFPVPMRVENFESDRLLVRQQYAWRLFEPLIGHIEGERAVYWRTVEVPYIPRFAYEETLATFRDEPFDPKGVLLPLVHLTTHLTRGVVSSFRLLAEPEERREVLTKFAATDQAAEREVAPSTADESRTDVLVRRAEKAYVELDETLQKAATWLWLRLVRIAPDDVSQVTRARVQQADLDEPMARAAQVFLSAGVIVATDVRYEAADSALVTTWPRLRQWIDEYRATILWRQNLEARALEWAQLRRDDSLLLQGAALRAALDWPQTGPASRAEEEFIEASVRAARRRRRMMTLLTAAAVLAVTIAVATIWRWREREARVARANRIVEAAEASRDPAEALLLLLETKGLPEPENGVERARRLIAQPVPISILHAGDAVNAIAFDPEGRHIVAASNDAVRVWEAVSGKVVRTRTFEGILDSEIRTAIMPRTDLVVFATRDGRIRAMREHLTDIRLPDDAKSTIVLHAPNARRLIAVGAEGIYGLYPENASAVLFVPLSFEDLRSGRPFAGAFSAEGTYVAVASLNGATFVNVVTGTVRDLGATIAPITGIALDASGNRVALSTERTIEVKDAHTDDSLYFGKAMESPTSVGLSPAGDLVSWGTENGVVRMTSMQGTPIDLRGHRSRVTAVAFSTVGKKLATASEDGTVRVWHAEPELELLRFSWDEIRPMFLTRTTACLSSTQRTQLLGETREVADARADACESRWGRER